MLIVGPKLFIFHSAAQTSQELIFHFINTYVPTKETWNYLGLIGNSILNIFQFYYLFIYHDFRFKSLNVDKEAELERYKVLAERLRPMVIESVSFLHAQMKLDKHVLVEGANAAMLDIDFGKSFFLFFLIIPNLLWLFC